MRLVTTVTGATLLFAYMACASVQPACAQDTTVSTLPLTIQALSQIDTTNSTLVGGSALSTRVKVNINNDNLSDAIKKVIGKADVTYEIDSDVPEDVKVSLKADNILLSTAINVITESAGIGCTETTRMRVEDSNSSSGAKAMHIHLHFRKAATPPLGQGPSSWLVNIPSTVFDKNAWMNNTLTSPNGTIDKDYYYFKNQPGGIIYSPNDATNYTNKLLDNMKLTVPTNGAAPFLYNLTTSEERLTFTCPHCHEQVTIIKKHVAPKCPTCGRTFQDDWKFCPVDGTKRPEDPGAWKFCPHCGKPIS